MSASVSACVFPTMPTCEGTCSQHTAAPACPIFPKELLPQVHVAHRPARTLPVMAPPFAGFACGPHDQKF